MYVTMVLSCSLEPPPTVQRGMTNCQDLSLLTHRNTFNCTPSHKVLATVLYCVWLYHELTMYRDVLYICLMLTTRSPWRF